MITLVCSSLFQLINEEHFFLIYCCCFKYLSVVQNVIQITIYKWFVFSSFVCLLEKQETNVCNRNIITMVFFSGSNIVLCNLDSLCKQTHFSGQMFLSKADIFII